MQPQNFWPCLYKVLTCALCSLAKWKVHGSRWTIFCEISPKRLVFSSNFKISTPISTKVPNSPDIWEEICEEWGNFWHLRGNFLVGNWQLGHSPIFDPVTYVTLFQYPVAQVTEEHQFGLLTWFWGFYGLKMQKTVPKNISPFACNVQKGYWKSLRMWLFHRPEQ